MAIEESTKHISGRLLVDAESAFRYNPGPDNAYKQRREVRWKNARCGGVISSPGPSGRSAPRWCRRPRPTTADQNI